MPINAFTVTELPSLLERLGQDHARIAQKLARLADAVDRQEFAQDDDKPALWIEISDCMHFLEHYADRIHHPLEDRLFDAILHKGLTPTERHLVFRNLGQHEEIMQLTESLLTQLQLARNEVDVDLSSFFELTAQYLALQRRHMTFEEMHMFPLLMARLDNSDWNRLQGELSRQFSVDAPAPLS